ncbi:transposase [Bacillus subtilis]
MQRRKHSAEFKQQVVQEAIETGNKALVARCHELSPNLVSKWVKAFQEKRQSRSFRHSRYCFSLRDQTVGGGE